MVKRGPHRVTDLLTSVCLSCLFISVCLFVSVCLSGVCRLSLCLSVCLSVSVCLFVSAGLRAGSTLPFWLKSLPVQSSPVLPVVHSPVQSKLRSSIIPFHRNMNNETINTLWPSLLKHCTAPSPSRPRHRHADQPGTLPEVRRADPGTATGTATTTYQRVAPGTAMPTTLGPMAS